MTVLPYDPDDDTAPDWVKRALRSRDRKWHSRQAQRHIVKDVVRRALSE